MNRFVCRIVNRVTKSWTRRVATAAVVGASVPLWFATSATAQPVNDTCANLISLTLNQTEFGDNIDATATPGVMPICVDAPAREVWYEFFAPFDGTFRFTLQFGLQMSMAFYRDCSDPQTLACSIECDDFVRLTRTMTFNERIVIWVNPGCDGTDAFFSIGVDELPTPPANDACANAEIVTAMSVTPGGTFGASGTDPDPSCGSQDAFDVWYQFTNTEPTAKVYRFNAIPSTQNFDPTLTIFSACGGTQLGCANNAGTTSSPLAAALNLLMAPGQTIRLRVAGNFYGEGAFDLNVSEAMNQAPNDTCASALPVTPGSFVISSTNNATPGDDAVTPCIDNDTVDIWFELFNNEPEPRAVRVRAGSSSLEAPSLAAFSSCGGTLLDCDVGANFNAFPESEIQVTIGAMSSVLIRFAGREGSIGDFVLNIEAAQVVPSAPANDLCSGAIELTSFPSTTFAEAGAATPDLEIDCDSVDGSSSKGVWYTFVPTTDCTLWLWNADLWPEWSYSVYSGTCGALTPVSCVSINPAAVALLDTGVRYYLLISAANPAQVRILDRAVVEVDCRERPAASDTCAGAGLLSLPIRGHFNNDGASNEGLTEAGAGSCNDPDVLAVGMDNSVYFRWVAPASGTLHIDVTPWFTNGMVAVYSGTCGALTEVACGDDPEPIELEVPVTSGMNYVLQFGTYSTGWFGSDFVYDITFEQGVGCIADFDLNGDVDVVDLFAFLDAWFVQAGGGTGSPSADFDNDGAVEVDDLFDFLDAWFLQTGTC